MGDTSITLRLVGEPEDVPASAFLEAIYRFLNTLDEIDIVLSARPRGSLRWRIAQLSSSSPTITLAPESIVDDLDVSAEVIEAAVDGFETIEKESVRPQYFSDAALDNAARLVGVIGRGINRIDISAPRRPQIKITQRLAANVDEVIGGTEKALGTIEGTIEMVTIHERRQFNLYDALTHQAIACYFHPEMFESVKEALGKRVGVYGEIRTTRTGEIRSITAKEVNVFPSREELPQTDDIVGILPEMTHGLEIEEYIKRLHGD